MNIITFESWKLKAQHINALVATGVSIDNELKFQSCYQTLSTNT